MARRSRVRLNYLKGEIYKKVAEDLGISYDEVEYTYDLFIQHLIDQIGEADLSREYTPEEFKELRVNFNIPSVGKLGLPYERFRYLRDIYVKHNKLGKRYGRLQDKDD